MEMQFIYMENMIDTYKQVAIIPFTPHYYFRMILWQNIISALRYISAYISI